MKLPLIPDEISEVEKVDLIEKVARFIVNRKLTAPAILMLEVCKPINFVGSQFMLALNPFVQAIFNTIEYQKFALIIEKDENLELLIQCIEKLDADKQGK
ncbi:TPA: hypothetical protein EYN98_17900 [Candidatus Poribacteria bacterium]|jgi:hypothetical protein|nr:hypothetical protein [Candidatus Poribacteria bacterium]HIA67883.1 hypothetical protein [Candidatus Poribacteria bacterium]HIB89595.1 hypothetical protein [Candidatus Poribacteria bacterium]HIC00930.1 hypothetical protein [Candidatus Poribacteria bacterium]HIN31953.1 hypothetical protein [Candidatus Poribacteria bacterium]